MVKFLDNSIFPDGKPRHYHGDIVRVCFFIAGILMLLGLPFFQDQISLPTSLSMGAIVTIVFLAGLTNPRQPWLIFADFIVSLFGVAIFEYIAVNRFDGLSDIFFLINQFLALIFLVALYFSTKTLRGLYLRK